MKPFDLNAAMLGAPIQTREGKPVKFVAYTPEATDCSRIICFSGKLYLYRYSDGREHCHHDSPRDLVMAPIKKTYWANVYKSKTNVADCRVGASVFFNEADAVLIGTQNHDIYIKTISFEVEE